MTIIILTMDSGKQSKRAGFRPHIELLSA